jgi:hypothetical protein
MDPEMTKNVELVGKNIKIFIITIFHLFLEINEILYMLSKDM